MKIRGLAIVLAVVLSFPIQSIAASASEVGVEQSNDILLKSEKEEEDLKRANELGDKQEIENNDPESLNYRNFLESIGEEISNKIEVEQNDIQNISPDSIKLFETPLVQNSSVNLYESEPNDMPNQANNIENHIYGEVYTLFGTITNHYQDMDNYSFKVNTKGNFTLVGMWMGNYYRKNFEDDLVIALMDSDYQIITLASLKTNSDGYRSRNIGITLNPGTYYILAMQSSNYKSLYIGETYGVGFMFEPERDTKEFVLRLYEKVLNRQPGTEEVNYHNKTLNNQQTTGADVARGFIFSPEVTNKKLSNTEFIKMLYQAFMGRNSDASGLAYWKSMLDNGVTREYVFKGFVESGEFTDICNSYGITRGNVNLTEPRDQNANLTMFISRCYEKALGRTAEASGLNYYAQEILLKRVTPLQASQNFIFSPEFKNKNLSSTDYVKVLYRTFMGREFDQSGLNYHLNRMKNGTGREEILLGFANSPEFKEIMSGFGL